MNACTSCAPSGGHVRPVPIAHTGSYAMTMFFISSALTPLSPLASWIAHTSLFRPLSYSSFVSPMHRMGLRPASRIVRTFVLMIESSSPKIVRRSEWPARRVLDALDRLEHARAHGARVSRCARFPSLLLGVQVLRARARDARALQDLRDRREVRERHADRAARRRRVELRDRRREPFASASRRRVHLRHVFASERKKRATRARERERASARNEAKMRATRARARAAPSIRAHARRSASGTRGRS